MLAMLQSRLQHFKWQSSNSPRICCCRRDPHGGSSKCCIWALLAIVGNDFSFLSQVFCLPTEFPTFAALISEVEELRKAMFFCLPSCSPDFWHRCVQLLCNPSFTEHYAKCFLFAKLPILHTAFLLHAYTENKMKWVGGRREAIFGRK